MNIQWVTRWQVQFRGSAIPGSGEYEDSDGDVPVCIDSTHLDKMDAITRAESLFREEPYREIFVVPVQTIQQVI